MMKPQGSLYNLAVRSSIGMEVYLLQVIVGRGDESVVVETSARSVGAASKRRFDPVYWNIKSECHTTWC